MGDFDSLGYIPKGDNVYIYPSEKDDSDVGIAIEYGYDKGYKSFILYGCIGGRFDHSFANVQLLSKIAERGGRGFIVGEKTIITVIKNSELEINGKGYISVFSLSDKSEGVTLENLKYTLSDSALENSFPLGLSNEFINENTPALLRVQNGVLLVVISEYN
jgi:thiamine pyrophosphokinase